jgi:predicted alpha/beta hydrolase family esterase
MLRPNDKDGPGSDLSFLHVVILHGTKGSASGNWYAWLKTELEKKGAQVSVPSFPTPDGQSLLSWSNAFTEQVGKIDKQTVLVGHSAGAVFALRLLEKTQTPIRWLTLVSPFVGILGIPDYDRLNSTFLEEPIDWSRVLKNAGGHSLYFGDADPYVPIEQSQHVASSLHLRPHIISGGGHLNEESGFRTFPALLDEICGLSQG